MKRTLFISIFPFLASQVTGQNCMTLFSYGASFETVQFFNQSEMSNAHYWWNFGDGTGSYYDNPVHTYPENGRYLVTLYAKDTVSNCSDYHELWLNVTKYSTDTCQPNITDSVSFSNGANNLRIIELSSNCEVYNVNLDGGPAFNFPPGNSIYVGDGWKTARFLSRIQYTTYDTINGYEVHREAYKTTPMNGYSSGVNYDDCSANFEFTVIDEDATGQKWLFTAMNRNATSYDWTVPGYGNPIHFYSDTMTFFIQFTPNDMKNITLKVEDNNGCRDTLTQQILIRSGLSTTVDVRDIELPTVSVQVYPNPFSESTVLQFDNPRFIRHELTLFNPTGQVVKVFNNVTSGQVTIDRENLANGVYFYQLQSDSGQTATGKLIVN